MGSAQTRPSSCVAGIPPEIDRSAPRHPGSLEPEQKKPRSNGIREEAAGTFTKVAWRKPGLLSVEFQSSTGLVSGGFGEWAMEKIDGFFRCELAWPRIPPAGNDKRRGRIDCRTSECRDLQHLRKK